MSCIRVGHFIVERPRKTLPSVNSTDGKGHASYIFKRVHSSSKLFDSIRTFYFFESNLLILSHFHAKWFTSLFLSFFWPSWFNTLVHTVFIYPRYRHKIPCFTHVFCLWTFLTRSPRCRIQRMCLFNPLAFPFSCIFYLFHTTCLLPLIFHSRFLNWLSYTPSLLNVFWFERPWIIAPGHTRS